MIVSECPQIAPVLADDPSRPQGLHLSTVIGDLCAHLDPKRYGQPRDAAAVVKMGMGLAYEDVLEGQLRSLLLKDTFRPGPLQIDGIWMSPDGIDPDEWAVREYKLTWYSMKKWPCPYAEVYWPWIVQIKSYCRAVGAELAYLTVLFVNGDYAPPKPHPPRTWRLQFDPGDLDETWHMIVTHAKSRGWI